MRERAHGDDPAVRSRERGSALIDLGRPADALVDLRSAIAHDPGDSHAHCLIALAHVRLDQPREALEAARAGAALDPEDAWPQRLMAIALGKLGKKRLAKTAALEACRLDPEEPMAHIVLSGALQEARDEAGALAAARHAVELDPGSADAQHQVGSVLLAHERLAEAEAAFHAALELNPEHSHALNNLALVHLQMQRRGEALDELQTAARIDPRSEAVRQNLLLIGGARMKRRAAVVLGGLGVLALPSGQGNATVGAVALLVIAAVLEFLRWRSLQALDVPTRTLVHDDARARRFNPTRWEWKWLLQLRPWWWLLIREGAKRMPAWLVLGVNLAGLALAAVGRNGGWVIIMALGLPFTAWRFHREWRRKHPPKGSWKPRDSA